MYADVIDLSKYREKMKQQELEKLKSKVDAIIEELPSENTTGWYSGYDYCTWPISSLSNTEYFYGPSNACPYCGKSEDEE